MIDKCRLVAWLVDDQLLLRDFGPYGIIFMMCMFFYNWCNGNAVKVFCPLLDNILACALL
jgi:hypothetical protein